MANIKRRKLPVGVQSFKKIREGGYVYVDKTDIVWELANYGDQYNYLSRPRRFGKSVLVDTLEAYFSGRKELFEGLKIMDMEDDWKQYPVIRLDMSRGGASAEGIRSYLNLSFKSYEQKYAITPDPTAQLADRFDAIITTAYQHPVVVRVFALVAVDEHQIERASECRSDVERRTDVVSDLMPVRAAAEERGGDLLQLVVHLHRVEHAALLESGGHAEGRIPRKSAYFQDVAGP